MAVMYLVGATNENYGTDAIAYVGQFAETINEVAAQLGISAGAVAGAMAEERQAYDSMDSTLDKYAQSGFDPNEALATLPEALEGGGAGVLVWAGTHAAQLVTTRTHEQWQALFGAAQMFVGKPSNIDKVLNPALIDVGLGNFKISTAIDIIVKYASKYPSLDLTKYLTHYDSLVADLIDDRSGLTATLYGVYIKEYAEPFFRVNSAYAGQWDSLSQTFRDALLVTYTNLGQSAMEGLMRSPYEPQPALTSGGGMNHLLNASSIGAALGLSGYGSDAFGVADFVMQAKSSGGAGFAARHALSELRYVSIGDVDYGSKNVDGALSLVSEGGVISDSWIEDRARLLVTLTKISVNGSSNWLNDPSALGDRDLVFHYADPKDGAAKTVGLSLDSTARADQEIFFGTDAAEALTGTNNQLGDRLYGGGGNDTIKGLGGADYLEGNAGDDTLDGGEGNDTLVGGTGNDRYEFSGSFGDDLVVDSEGNGSVWIDGAQLTGGKKIQGLSNSWISDDKRWRFELGSNGDLLIRHADGSGGSVLLRGWQDGGGNRLGINLEETPAPTPQTPSLRIYLGDQAAPLTTNTSNAPNFVPTYDWGATTWQIDGTLSGGVAQADFDDVIRADLIDLDTDTRIFGYGGNDALGGADGDDEIDGGEGDDLIAGGKGSNTLRGGAGNDFISASSYIVASQRFKPDETWSGVPAGATVLGAGPTWAAYVTASGEQIWGGVSATPIDVSTGSVIDAGEGNDQALGSWGSDTIYMGEGNDVTYGLAGRDVIYGEDGNDRLFGDGVEDTGFLVTVPEEQHGDDLIDGGAGNDFINGQGGDDVLLGGEGDDQLVGGAGADMLYGGAGNDRLYGDDEDQDAGGAEPDDYLDGGEGDDLLVGGEGQDELLGRAGDDSLVGGAGRDTLRGGEGADTLNGDGGNLNDESSDDGDLLDGGDGNDQLDGEGGDDILLGGSGDDRLWGGVGADVLEGGVGSDLLFGQDGDDVLSGGGGADVLFGGLGNDTLHLDGQDFADGGQGDDVYHLASVSVGASGEVPVSLISDVQGQNQLVVDGAAPVNLADVQVFAQDGHLFAALGSSALVGLADGATLAQLSVRANGQGGAEQLTSLQAVVQRDDDSARVRTGVWVNGVVVHTSSIDTAQTIVGSSANDLVEGGRGSDVLRGQAGDDALVGGEGNDTLYAGGGNNVLEGGLGNDELNVGSADELSATTDTVVYRLGDGLDHIQVSEGTQAGSKHLILEFGEGLSLADLDLDSFNGSESGEHWLTFGPGQGLVLTTGTAELVQELRFADGTSMSRSEWVEWLQSHNFSGSTTVGDEYADSTLVGTANNDHLLGGRGNDVLSGGLGNDLLEGAGGHNRYVFHADSGRDQILVHDGESAELLFTQANLAQLTVLQDAAGITVRIDDANSVQLSSVSGDVQALLQVVISDGQGASQSLGAILGAPTPSEPLSLQDRRDEFLDAQHQELDTLGQRYVETYGRYSGPEFLARPDVVETSEVQLSEGVEYLHGSYLTVSSITEEQTFSRRVPVYETVTTTVGETVEVFVPVSSGVATEGNPDLAGATAVRDEQGRVIGFLVPTLSGAREVTESRLVGWETETYTVLNTIAQDTAHQVQLQGTSGADVIRPDDASAQTTLDGYGNEAAYPVLFRGSIETGDGDDLIVLNSGSNGRFPGVDSNADDWGFMNLDDYGYQVSDHYFRGRGAWIDAGNGNDTVQGTDGHDVIVGGSGSDTMDGQAGSDLYLIGFESGVVDHIVEVAHFNPYGGLTWEGSLFQTYGGDMTRQNMDTVEFDASVQLERLTYRIIGDEPTQGWQGYEQWVTLQLFMDHVFFLEVNIPAVDAVSGVSLPGIDVFRFADGTEFQTRALLDLLSQEAAVEPLNLVGGEGNDVLIGAAGDDTLSGVAGDDQLIGGAGNDVLDGGTGLDVLLGGDGDDQYVLRLGDDWGVTSEIQDALGSNTVLLQEGNLADMALSAQDGGWLWRYSTNDAVLLNGEFSVNLNGQAFSLQALEAAIAAAGASQQPEPEQEEPAVAQDALVGEDADDDLTASEGHTQVWGGGGNDVLTGYWGGAELIGGAGDDTVLAAGGANNTLHGGSGDDVLIGDWGADTLFGGMGNDTLEGAGGSDVLVGGAGDDLLQGGAAADNYRFGVGDGNDRLIDLGAAWELSTVELGQGVTPDDVQMEVVEDGVRLRLSPGDSLTLVGLNSDTAQGAGLVIQFADGTRWDSLQIVSAALIAAAGADDGRTPTIGALVGGLQDDTLSASAAQVEVWGLGGNDVLSGYWDASRLFGGSGNDVLNAVGGVGTVVDGGSGNDVLYAGWGSTTLLGGAGDDILYANAGTNNVVDGGAGNDELVGGWGNEQYLWGRGGGNDVIREVSGGGFDTLHIGAEVSADQIWLQRANNDLVLSIVGTSDSLTLADWYANDQARVEAVVLSSELSLQTAQVDALVAAMASFAPPAAGVSHLPESYQSVLAPVIAVGWQ